MTADGVAAKVSVDDTPVGLLPWEGDVLAGHHVLEVSAPGYAPYKVGKDVTYKSSLDVDVKLEQERHEGTLSVDTGDAKSTISLDGRVVGGGSWTGTIPSGGHQLVVVRDGYKSYRSDVTVLDHQQRSVTVVLEAESSSTIWWARELHTRDRALAKAA